MPGAPPDFTTTNFQGWFHKDYVWVVGLGMSLALDDEDVGELEEIMKQWKLVRYPKKKL